MLFYIELLICFAWLIQQANLSYRELWHDLYTKEKLVIHIKFITSNTISVWVPNANAQEGRNCFI